MKPKPKPSSSSSYINPPPSLSLSLGFHVVQSFDVLQMETTCDSSLLPNNAFSLSLCIALVSTAFSGFLLLWVLFGSFKKPKSAKKVKSCNCVCSCSGEGERGTSSESFPNGREEEEEEEEEEDEEEEMTQVEGTSMMEQLVPEITTHTLSYLDYPSLCRLSMTNSLMRRAANDDTAWKALYHKDFTLEQDGVTPPNGWKAYYAATRAIVNVNAEFYNIIRERSFQGMQRFWLHTDYVKCVHGTGELFTGYNAVIQSWQLAFDWGQGVAFQIRDVRARVLTDMAWVTMKTYIDMEQGPFHVTNVYEFHNGQWFMVHHHSSVVLIDVELEHQNVFG